ncbi:MAG: HPr family phosphocarrier protein [Alphaproteobacteria bacterium]|nr:HPr family phosphocarrier protein [Alphaproteobacteria bacterium]NCB49422.1 HPr family phosphocarrier protein [Alphaproteobacteria bacterium]
MQEKVLKIQNKKGLHARAAALFVKTVDTFLSKVKVTKDDLTVDGDSIMGLMTLGASKDTEVLVSVDGIDEKEALDKIEELLFQKFYEEEV